MRSKVKFKLPPCQGVKDNKTQWYLVAGCLLCLTDTSCFAGVYPWTGRNGQAVDLDCDLVWPWHWGTRPFIAQRPVGSQCKDQHTKRVSLWSSVVFWPQYAKTRFSTTFRMKIWTSWDDQNKKWNLIFWPKLHISINILTNSYGPASTEMWANPFKVILFNWKLTALGPIDLFPWDICEILATFTSQL